VNQPNQHEVRALAAPLKGVIQSALVGLFMASLPMAQAATIQIKVNMASGATIKSSDGVNNVTGGTAYVGSFLNSAGGQMLKSEIAQVVGFNNLWTKFVAAISGAVTNGRFSINDLAEVENVGGVSGKSLVGNDIYVLVVDNATSPTGFLLLASDGGGVFDVFDDPEFNINPVRVVLNGAEFVIEGDDPIPASASIVGTAGTYSLANDAWSMVAIEGAAPIALNGSLSVTHFWGSTYVDDGATQNVTPVIKDASDNVITNFAVMSSKLGTYTVAYTSGGTTVTRTVAVKLHNPSADDDKDGLSNLLEYVLGGSLSSNDSAKLPVVSVVGSEVLLTFTARSDINPATDVALRFLTTTTLSSAFQQELLSKKSGVLQGTTPVGYEKQQWVLGITSISKKFVRLQVAITAALTSGV